MKKNVLVALALLGLTTPAWAGQMGGAVVEMGKGIPSVEVNNKVCPVSGEKIGGMGEPASVEHNGKVYQLCCEMCKKDFLKNPEKYGAVAEAEGK